MNLYLSTVYFWLKWQHLYWIFSNWSLCSHKLEVMIHGDGKLEIKSINDHFDDMRDKIRESIFDKHQLKVVLERVEAK